MEYRVHYDCKHYFGQRKVYARTEEEAKLSCKLLCENEHPTKYDSSIEVKRDCGINCKLKVKIL